MTRATITSMAAGYALLVAHLLFIPYAFEPLAPEEALRAFSGIRWIALGADQNVAFVSRALMFVPLGLLLCVSFAPRPIGRGRLFASVAAIALGCAWAIVVNFAQLWFPSRTVILNNVAAEAIGVTIGALSWSLAGAECLRWWSRLTAGGFASLGAALTGYVLVYVFASLAPFDFVTNPAELSAKAASGTYALWTTAGSCGRVPCALQNAILFIVSIPCGWWLAARGLASSANRVRCALVALALSFALEFVQFLMVSGVSQGSSLVVRAVGLMAGVEVYAWRHWLAAIGWNRLANRFGRGVVLALLPAYFAAIAYVGGWFRAPRLDFSAGLQRVDELVWMPFFYHYYEGYQDTMLSTILHLALYAPVGVACWLWSHRRERVPVSSAVVLAAGLSFIAESSKLFLAGKHPDYTDVLVAIVAASAALVILRYVSRSAQRAAGDARIAAVRGAASVAAAAPGAVAAAGAHGARAAGSRRTDETRSPAIHGRARGTTNRALAGAAGVLALATAAWLVIDFPLWRVSLALGLAAYAALLVRQPVAYLIAVPALLPVLDLAPFSGRFFFDEFDALLAMTIGIRLLTGIPAPRDAVRIPRFAFGVLLLSVAVSTVIGLWPLAPLDANAFSTYLSPYNALRVAKGYGWAAIFVWLIARDFAAGRAAVPGLLMAGLATGLATAAGGVLWERLSFVGAPEFDASFRAAGLVSATHVGGAYLEAILVMLTPPALAVSIWATRRVDRGLAILAVVAGAAAVMMTVSRAAYAGWVAAVVTFMLAWWLTRLRRAKPGQRWLNLRRGAMLAAALVAVSLAALAATRFSVLGERLASTQKDFSTRAAHWGDALDLMARNPLQVLFGVGLGSFPREFYFAQATSRRLPAYAIVGGAGREPSHLVLAGGRGMYIDQWIDATPGDELTFSGLVRSPQPGSRLGISLCAKSFLNSVGCTSANFEAGLDWQRFEARISVPARQGVHPPIPMPLALSLSNGRAGSRVEVARLSLREGTTELLANGAFDRGLDRWFVTSDVHMAWRILNTPLQIAFEQGLLGVLAWLLLAGAVLSTLVKGNLSQPSIACFAGSAVGLLFVGSFDSLLDSPRIVLLAGAVLAVTLAHGDRYRSTVPASRND